jgi:hypothetical protein
MWGAAGAVGRSAPAAHATCTLRERRACPAPAAHPVAAAVVRPNSCAAPFERLIAVPPLSSCQIAALPDPRAHSPRAATAAVGENGVSGEPGEPP